MSKRIISVILVAMLVVAMGSVAMVSASAASLPAKADGCNRYYFYVPNDKWVADNSYTDTVGIYWWEGTDFCDDWPGHKANKADAPNVYYMDVPQDVCVIIWNNYVDGGTDTTADIYSNAFQIKDLGCEYYDPDESENYPDGTDSFDEMIYVIDTAAGAGTNDLSGKETYSGEWFYYYGNGEYGWTPEKGAEVFTSRTFHGTPVVTPAETTPAETTPADDDTSVDNETTTAPQKDEVVVPDATTPDVTPDAPEADDTVTPDAPEADDTVTPDAPEADPSTEDEITPDVPGDDEPTDEPEATDATGSTDAPAQDKPADTVTTGIESTVSVVLAVLAMAAAAIVVLRKKVNG